MNIVKVIPCSGIGKVYGLMAREAALEITSELRPDTTGTVCLAHLVTGDECAVERVRGLPCVTIDGCAAHCAAKSVEAAGGLVAAQYKSVDAMRNHRGVHAGTATALTDEGWAIVRELAETICETIDTLQGEGEAV